MTRYADQFAGKSHEFKFGFEFERSKIVNEYGYPGGRLYYDYGGAPYLVTLWDGYVTNATGKARERVRAGHLDGERPADHQPGNPVQHQSRVGAGQGDRAQDQPRFRRGSASRGTFAPITAASSGCTTGGITTRCSAARIYHMDTSQQHPKITALVLGPDEFEEIDRVDVANNVGIDPDVKPSYVDQYIAGIEHELMPDLSVQVQYIRRNYKDFMGFVDTGAIYDPVQRRDPGPDNTLDTADDGRAHHGVQQDRGHLPQPDES